MKHGYRRTFIQTFFATLIAILIPAAVLTVPYTYVGLQGLFDSDDGVPRYPENIGYAVDLLNVLIGIPVAVAVAWVAVILARQAERNSSATLQVTRQWAEFELVKTIQQEVGHIQEKSWAVIKAIGQSLQAVTCLPILGPSET
ncbi:hypothetical protein KHP57_04780 [Algiphilus sp. NNCM1]|uniref:hypothetical protein n=1 Tax=Algiphilus sp. TaxID=1872431 RepID=UPI001CA5FE9E|nr:hypothetical protein [Algiphilus sp.]MBY8965012.1 hypothetical protein [Algiphilus acroporae]MCI5104168.1 hypothetical protein [Algiphilus sp.]